MMNISEECYNDIKEMVINEVSVGTLARAVENNLPKRKKQLADATKATEAGWKEYEEQAKKYPEEESALYKKAEATDKAASKQFDKAEHAQDLANLKLPKDSKVNANKLFKAGHKVANGREDKMMNAHKNGESAKQFVKRLNRSDRADNIVIADPVKSRVAESLIDGALSIIEKVTVSQWKQAAKNSIPTRKAQEEKASSNLEEIIYPFRGAAYDPKNKRANAWDEAAYRLDRAEQLVKNLPNSNKSATKFKAVAKNVVSKQK